MTTDQSNYSSRIVLSHIPIEFGQTGISAIRSADPENSTVEPNMKWIGKSWQNKTCWKEHFEDWAIQYMTSSVEFWVSSWTLSVTELPRVIWRQVRKVAPGVTLDQGAGRTIRQRSNHWRPVCLSGGHHNVVRLSWPELHVAAGIVHHFTCDVTSASSLSSLTSPEWRCQLQQPSRDSPSPPSHLQLTRFRHREISRLPVRRLGGQWRPVRHGFIIDVRADGPCSRWINWCPGRRRVYPHTASEERHLWQSALIRLSAFQIDFVPIKAIKLVRVVYVYTYTRDYTLRLEAPSSADVFDTSLIGPPDADRRHWASDWLVS